MQPNHSIRLTAVATVLVVSAPALQANEPDWPTVELQASAYITAFNSDLRVDSDTGIVGTDLALEDELDLEEDLDEIRADLRWRFLPRHRLSFAYYDISRSGERQADRTLRIGDELFPLNIELDSQLDFEVYKFSYAFAFAHTDNVDASVSLGLHTIDLDFEVQGSVPNATVETHRSGYTVPLPVVGVHLSRRLGKAFVVNLNAELFAVDYEDVSGRFADLGASIDLVLTDAIALNVGYNWVDMDIESDDPDLLGEFQYRYGAVSAGVKLVF